MNDFKVGVVYVSHNDCCGGADGLEVVDADEVRVWVSGMCGGSIPYPDEREWTPLDEAASTWLGRDGTTVEDVLDDREVMGDRKYALADGKWRVVRPVVVYNPEPDKVAWVTQLDPTDRPVARRRMYANAVVKEAVAAGQSVPDGATLVALYSEEALNSMWRHLQSREPIEVKT